MCGFVTEYMDFVFRMCRFIGRLRSFVRFVYINKVYVGRCGLACCFTSCMPVLHTLYCAVCMPPMRSMAWRHAVIVALRTVVGGARMVAERGRGSLRVMM